MDPSTVAIIGAGIAGLGTAAGAWFGRRSRVDSTATTTSAESSQTVSVDLNELVRLATAGQDAEIARLKERLLTVERELELQKRAERIDHATIADLRSRVRTLETELDLLRTWVRAQGHDPDIIVTEVADAYVTDLEADAP
jgi:small-conductance mechanosensitive channel